MSYKKPALALTYPSPSGVARKRATSLPPVTRNGHRNPFPDEPASSYHGSEPTNKKRKVANDGPREEPRTEVLSYDQLEVDLGNMVSQLADVTALDKSLCSQVLALFDWDVAAAIDKFTAFATPEDFLEAHSLMDYALKHSGADNMLDGECLICQETALLIILPCGHNACWSCWLGYLQNKIDSDSEYPVMCCGHQCDAVLTDTMVRMILESDTDCESTLKEFTKLTIRHYVRSNSSLVACPNPQCDLVTRFHGPPSRTHVGEGIRDHLSYTPLKCACGAQACPKCTKEFHAPVTCATIQVFEYSVDDGANEAYFHRFTKNCPNCRAKIEKNGGCDHMTCKKCSFQFCWICCRPWHYTHGSLCSFTNNRPQNIQSAEFNHIAAKKDLFWYKQAHREVETLREMLATYSRLTTPTQPDSSVDPVFQSVHSRFVGDMIHECLGFALYLRNCFVLIESISDYGYSKNLNDHVTRFRLQISSMVDWLIIELDASEFCASERNNECSDLTRRLRESYDGLRAHIRTNYTWCEFVDVH